MAGLPEEGIAFGGFGFKRDAAGFSQTDNEADLPLGCGNIATKLGQDKGVVDKPKVCELHPDSKATGGEFQ
eukprot:CAMPEP_0201880456 /NCGR_PEP_ID=MMETSP0902-20130614/11033_1 /ASSEMBLY_ACC=CAM_ASM_000551 /TAXON_ID=420261 /ORGANISM="Thalassiosira antarctica, Strain CCMP982" /LENGTH=70 /DNA_ID=CAMNT_0048408463 /DNA_START=1 /DNA_END=210 /DNA_ORIENTATION=+